MRLKHIISPTLAALSFRLALILSYVRRMAICLGCLYFTVSIMAQNCVDIDFETFPVGQPIDGLIFSDQFEADFGISFSLRDGGFPRIANVGLPTTAFGPTDQPLPGEDAGAFFLADDGTFVSHDAETLVITFSRPMKKVSGCFLDVDSDERFAIKILDSASNLMQIDSVVSGTPGTGDAILACWEYEEPTCTGIYAIHIEGIRYDPNVFGFGYDNFSFCYLQEDFADLVSIQSETSSCLVDDGNISLTNSGSLALNYSIDGFNFQTDPTFNELANGDYQIQMINEHGCKDSLNVSLTPELPELEILDMLSASCESNNANLLATAIGGHEPYSFSIDGIDFLNSGYFDELGSGEYVIYVQDDYGCMDTMIIEINELVSPLISQVKVESTSCGEANGSLHAEAIVSSGEVFYSIDGDNFQQENDFYNLPAGGYTIYIKDENDCVEQTATEILSSAAMTLKSVESRAANCGESDGSIAIEVEGGTGSVHMFLNEVPSPEGLSLNFLEAGFYELLIVDETACELHSEILVEEDLCPIYIPNVFSPNGDGINDSFRIYPHPNFQGAFQTLRIFNRWGGMVFEALNFSPGEAQWSGNLNGRTMNPDVFTYYLEVLHKNNQVELFKGSVSLLR